MEGRKEKMVNSVELNFDTIVSQNKSIDATELDNEKVMMNISKGQYYALNSVGSKIWDVIEDNAVKYRDDIHLNHSENNHHNGDLQSEKRYKCLLKCEGSKTYNQPGNCPDCNLKMVLVGDEHFHH